MSTHAVEREDHTWDSYTVQTWRDARRIHDDLTGLSLAGAREVARAHMHAGYVARIMSEQHDYCEVYPPHGDIRRGTLARTTMVHFTAPEKEVTR